MKSVLKRHVCTLDILLAIGIYHFQHSTIKNDKYVAKK